MKQIWIILCVLAAIVLLFLVIDYAFKKGWLHQRHPLTSYASFAEPNI